MTFSVASSAAARWIGILVILTKQLKNRYAADYAWDLLISDAPIAANSTSGRTRTWMRIWSVFGVHWKRLRRA